MPTPRNRSRGPLELAVALLAILAFASAAQQGRAEPVASRTQPAAQTVPTESGAPIDAPARSWALRVPSADKVVFRGDVSYDAAGMGTGAMVYPVPGAAGLLVAVIAHGLVTNDLRQRQKDRMQLEADRVLEPFEPVLDAFTNQQLMVAGLQRTSVGGRKRVLAPAEPAGADWLIESAPVFSMTQDQRALVLDNALRIFSPGSTTVSYAQTIRVVSAPLVVPAPTTQPEAPNPPGVAPLWLQSQGRLLIDESTALIAESLDVALTDAVKPVGEANAPYQTFRYPQGGSERMERAQLDVEHCGRTLVRTLRGGLWSIPIGAQDGDARCTARLSGR